MLSAKFRSAFHWENNTTGVINIIFKCKTSGAQTSFGNGVVLITLNVIDNAIFSNINLKTAAYGMTTWGRPHGSTDNGEITFLVLPGLAKIVFELHSNLPSLFQFCSTLLFLSDCLLLAPTAPKGCYPAQFGR